MTRCPKKLKLEAAIAHEWAHHNMSGAKERLRQVWKGKFPSDLYDFITTWHTRLSEDLTLDDKPRSGRPRTIK